LLSLSISVSAAEKKAAHTCRILYLNAPPDAPEKLHLFDGKESTEVELPGMNFSPVYKVAGGDVTIVLSGVPYSLPEDVDPKAPRARVPAAVKDFYLLLAHDPDNSVAPVRMQVVPVDGAKFKRGDMLWFNLTNNQVGGKVGKRKLAMKAQSKVVVEAPAAGNEDYNVNLAFRIPGKEHLYPLCETKWLHDPRSRTVVFVMSQEGSRTPRVMGFQDFRQKEKAN
jgi:hypothetical protein